jgi:multidrug efflux pump subunit AcrA (membrane-fusion protein)
VTVVEHRPWRRALLIITTVLVGILGALLGYGLGNQHAVSQAISLAELGAEVEAQQARLASLDAQLIDTRLNEQVMREATKTLRGDLTVAHQKMARLQEEITFYKGLMAPSSLRKGLQVAELELTPLEDEAVYDYQLLLTQVALRRTFIAGEVRIDVIGHTHDSPDTESVLSLTDLSDMKTYPLKFRFRYFQDLAGRLTLPEGFNPARVLVTANQNGKDPLQVIFPWPVSGQKAETQSVASGR